MPLVTPTLRSMTPYVALGQVKKESLFQLATERLPDVVRVPRFEARNPPRDGATRNLEQVDATH